MNGHFIIFGRGEIANLLLENNVKPEDVEEFVNAFDDPGQWIHLFKEWYDEKRLDRQ